MILLYNLGIRFYFFIIYLVSLVNDKAKKFIDGRKDFDGLLNNLKEHQGAYWFQASSLGEFEQGRYVIRRIKTLHPDQKIVLSFFSPSGFEVQKNFEFVDFVFYLPMDSQSNAIKVCDSLKPEKVFFIKYDFWHHFTFQIKKRGIPLYVIAASFRKNQIYFKWYGRFFKEILKRFDIIFTQKEEDNQILIANGINTGLKAGDPRIDRVQEIKENCHPVIPVNDFFQHKNGFVVGSGYVEEAKYIINALNEKLITDKVVFVPHDVSPKNIKELEILFKDFNPILYTKYEGEIGNSQIMIVNAVGFLFKIYQYANFVMIGGGFGKSIHNILEPAAFGCPICFGPHYDKFYEADDLIKIGASFTFNNYDQFKSHYLEYKNSRFGLSSKYIESNTGATEIILKSLNL